MASSSGNSAGSAPTQNSGSDGDLQNLRKRKRMQSNRESARRSRQRKQKQLDDLMAQVGQLREETGRISSSINVTTQHYVSVEAENSVLRAQMTELTQRLHSLNEILNYIDSGGGGYVFETDDGTCFDDGLLNSNNMWNPVVFNQLQPITTSTEMFDYY
ncbi:hypothetical protein OROMI_013741 [Orobanche minor]